MSGHLHDYSLPALWKESGGTSRAMGKGVTRRIVAHTEAGMMAVIDLEPGSAVPPHSHPHAQYGFCVSGSGRFVVDGREMSVAGGDGYYIPPAAGHEFRAGGEPTRLVEFFTPAREDLTEEAPQPNEPQSSTK